MQDEDYAKFLQSRPFFKGLGLTTPRHMTNRPITFEAVTPKQPYDDFVGATPVDSGTYPSWRSFKPPDATKDARHAHFSRVRRNSRVCTSEASIDGWLADAAVAYAFVEERAATGSPYYNSELGPWKKETVQRDNDVAWYVENTSPGLTELHLPREFHECLRHVVRVYRHSFEMAGSPLHARPDPSDTVGGFPLFTSGPVSKVASACFFDRSVAAMEDHARAWTQKRGLHDRCALANGIGKRQGPLYKARYVWELDAGRWQAVAKAAGAASRNRVIQMAPYCVNMTLRRWFAVLHEARRVIRGLWRTGNEDAMLHIGANFQYEADISGYDTSVTWQLQASLVDAFRAEWPEMAGDAATWFAAEQRGLIGPSWSRNPATCSIYSPVGGTSSGLKSTAEVGTIFAVAATVLALRDQGLKWQEWPNIPGVATSHQGDDVRVSSYVPFDIPAWADSYAKVGLNCELIEGWVFLSRHHTPDGALIPLAGRIVQQTMSNEHEPTDGDPEGILLLGLVARSTGWHLIPAELRQHVNRCIRHAEWMQRLGLPSIEAARAYASTTEGLALIERSVSQRAALPWLLAQQRDAEHSDAARRAWSLLQPFLKNRDLASLDRTTHQVAWRVASESRAVRDDLLTEIEDAVVGGSKSEDEMWASLVARYI